MGTSGDRVRHRKKLSFIVLAALVPPLFVAAQQASAAPVAPAHRLAPPRAKESPVIARGVPAADATGNAPQAINGLGLTKYASVYAGDVVNSDGSVTVLLGPGSATSVRASISKMLPESGMKAFGHEPTVKIERVPESIATLDSASRTLTGRASQLQAAGYELSNWAPDPQKGTLDVAISAAPKGISAAAATRYLQRTVSRYLVVTSVSAPLAQVTADRQQDTSPFYAGDLIADSSADDACTSGFTVIGTSGYPRAMTDAHCGNGTFTNGGYAVTPAFNLVTTSGAKQTFGVTSNYHLTNANASSGNLGADVQLLENPSDDVLGYEPYIWVGTGTSQPTPMPVVAPMSSYPAKGQDLTLDGAFTRTVRYVPVIQAGPAVCDKADIDGTNSTITICGLIELANTSADGVTPVIHQGDSGGPVFCYACSPNGAEPAGLIWADDPDGTGYASFIGVDLSATGAEMETSG
jgi:hypothetical protein